MESLQYPDFRLSLLYVEDEAEIRDLLRGVLIRKFPNLDIHVAENGMAGLEVFRERRPDIVLTDIRMPLMDGIQMSRAIREENPSANIIVISACSETD